MQRHTRQLDHKASSAEIVPNHQLQTDGGLLIHQRHLLVGAAVHATHFVEQEGCIII
jgi:hypothetical protein